MTRDGLLAGGRHILTALAGVGVGIGLYSIIDGETLKHGIEQISTGLTSIVSGISLITPIIMAIFAARSASPAAQIAKVKANPNVKEVVMVESPKP